MGNLQIMFLKKECGYTSDRLFVIFLVSCLLKYEDTEFQILKSYEVQLQMVPKQMYFNPNYSEINSIRPIPAIQQTLGVYYVSSDYFCTQNNPKIMFFGTNFEEFKVKSMRQTGLKDYVIIFSGNKVHLKNLTQ